MDRDLRVGVLGPLTVTVGGREIGPGGSLRRSLLALLALRPGEVHTVDSLVDGLWGQAPPQTATGVLQTYVSTWRKAFQAAGAGARIDTVGAGYRLELADGESDLLRATALTTEAQRLVTEGRPTDARERLEQALAQWRGPVLADLADRPFHAAATAPVEDAHRGTLEDWAELVLRIESDDDLAAVGGRLEQLLAENPWRERAAGLLMWTLVRRFRQHDALDVFDRTRRRLDEELGIDPGPALRSMHERVLRQDPGLLRRAGARARRAPRLDSFVGRDDDLRAIRDLLRRSRLVTLTGPGGSGKTRLAEEVAADVAAPSGGAAVVELAAVEDAEQVPGAVAARLGVQPAETLDALVARLADRRLLLVLDNLEQIHAVGAVVAGLLDGVPALRVLATSREPLHIAGEQLYAVDPLLVPGPAETDLERLAATPSVALLIDRARAADRRVDLTAEDAATMRDIVRILDGLPLALEIAAPWLGPLTPTGLLAELEHPLDVPGRRADAAARHRTLRMTITWSHDRLAPEQQLLLARLSVLRGGGDLDAVRALAGDDLGAPVAGALVALVESGLVRPADPVDGLARFRLLETVRQFAAERLSRHGGTTAAQLRAAEWYARWAVGLAQHSEGPGAEAWLAHAEADADNLRAAMDVLLRAGRTEDHLQLVVDTLALWLDLGYEVEGRRRLETALAAAPRSTSARAIGLVYLSWFVSVSDPHRALALTEEALDLARAADDVPVAALALTTIGDIAPDLERALECSRQAVDLAERTGRRPVRYAPASRTAVAGEALHNLAVHARYRDLPTALHWARRSLALVEESRDRRMVMRHHAQLGLLNLLAGDLPAAEACVAQAESLLSGSVTGRWEDTVALAAALVRHYRGEHDRAETGMRRIVASGLAEGRLLYVHYASCCLVDLLLDEGRTAEARSVLDHAEDLLDDGPDLRHLTRLRARRARLLRLTGRPEDAAALLRETERGIRPDELSPEHVIWLVEHAVLADSDGDAGAAGAWAERLETLSCRTGVRPLPWERRLLDRVAAR